MKILFIGDIFGSSGRKAVKQEISSIKKEKLIDFCIANAENAAGGSGITYTVAQDLYKMGVDAITMGNHTWSKREILNFIDSDERLIRPANYPEGTPGKGSCIINNAFGKIGVINLLGRVYMDSVDCPFRAAEREIAMLKKEVKVVIVDMHAEATSEKIALSWHVDGRVSAVVGTHTHVQTADERILPFGTATITDVGMTGPHEGIIGVERDVIIKKFMTQMPTKFEPAQGSAQFNAVILEVDNNTGKTLNIERINKIINF